MLVVTSIFNSSSSSSACWNKKTQLVLLNSLFYLFTGAISGLLNSGADVLWFEEKEITILYGVGIGCGLGFFSGWAIFLAEKAFQKCMRCSSCNKKDESENICNPDSKKLLKNTTTVGVNTVGGGVTRTLGKSFFRMLPMMIAGLSAAFSDDVFEWEWEPLKPQLVDLFIGGVIGTIVGFSKISYTHRQKILSCCEKKKDSNPIAVTLEQPLIIVSD